jgi:hypothetical protein
MFKRLFIGSRKSTGPHEETRNSGLDSEFAINPREADGPREETVKKVTGDSRKRKSSTIPVRAGSL